MFIGIDVGTQSARAGVFTAEGRMLGHASRPVNLHLGPDDRAEQSGAEIWRAVCAAVRAAVALADVAPGAIRAVGFDATCSLVLIDGQGQPLSVNDADPDRNVIVWMDHRATGQAERINAGQHDVLRYVGSRISPEMQMPKLLWLKENRPEVFGKLGLALDLADFLTWMATGSVARSTCTVTCKWTYLAHKGRWDTGFLGAIGLPELARDDFCIIGSDIRDPGTAVGELTAAAAQALGLPAGLPVSAGLIDAHAGAVGTLAARGGAGDMTSRMGYVMGTSACTMASSATAHFVPGVWGPYLSAVFPGLWLLEGGQSAAGAAIAALVDWHPAVAEARALAADAGMGLLDWLGAEAARTGGDAPSRLAQGWHILPDILGNRSPLADPQARGAIIGIGQHEPVARLVSLYVAVVASLGYGLRQILEAKRRAGLTIDTVVISGGLARSTVVRQILADSCGTPVARVTAAEPVLLGSAIAAAVAGGQFADLPGAAHAMSEMEPAERPTGGEVAAWHDRRYDRFILLQTATRD